MDHTWDMACDQSSFVKLFMNNTTLVFTTFILYFYLDYVLLINVTILEVLIVGLFYFLAFKDMGVMLSQIDTVDSVKSRVLYLRQVKAQLLK